MNIRLKTILLFYFIQSSIAANILAYIPLPFYSHQALYRPLWKELANRGHQITLLTPSPMERHENITQIDLSIIHERLEELHFYDVISSEDQSFKTIQFLLNIMGEIGDIELSHPDVQKIINSDDRFDLVITEFYLMIGAAFSKRFECPLIGIVSMDAQTNTHQILGNPTHPAIYPAFDLGFTGKLDFRQRFISSIFNVLWDIYNAYHLVPEQDIIIRKHFGQSMPSISDLIRNISLFFLNSNPVFHTVRPLSPQTINVFGGMHMEKPKSLPKDLQEFLDESSEGIIYFSLGSSVKSSQISSETKSVIIKSLAQLPFKVMWKFHQNETNLIDLPKNVLISKWFPQQDVLRHPNIKLFITQGGLHSLEEALLNGLPVLVLPFFGDQILNAQKVAEHGFGIVMDHTSLDVVSFRESILEVIKNRKYKEKAILIGKQLSDQPMTGLERAVFWTEYVLRNPNVELLKNPNKDLPFWQYYLLDIAFCILFVCALLYLFVLLLWRTALKVISCVIPANKRKQE